jgi:mannose-6-phosphate isomerase-like protein (cupin superfamily)
LTESTIRAILRMINLVDYLEAVMPVLPRPPAPTHDLGGARFTSLATPTRGSLDTAVWQVEILPGTPATPHSLTREEVFVVLEGRASVRIDGTAEAAAAGDAIVVPAGVDFELSNAGEEPLRLVCCLPVGGQATMAGGVPFTPPWAE